jgi:octaprenyl-diphosphate synthase
VLQLLNCHDADVDEDRYLQVIRYKTAKLFEAASRLGAMLAGVDADVEERFARFGMHLGTAFQLVDDILDYSGDEGSIGKNLGDDLAEGKPTLPLIHVMKNGTPEQVAVVRHAIEEGGRDDWADVLKAVVDSGALEIARVRAREEAELARAELAGLQANEYLQSLLDLATFAVERKF